MVVWLSHQGTSRTDTQVKASATCDRAVRENQKPTEHVCYKNLDRNKTSGAMEAEATSEAVNTSFEKYNVKKLECKNHKLRNHCNHLEKIGTTKTAHEVKEDAEFRKMVSSSKLRIREEILFRAKIEERISA